MQFLDIMYVLRVKMKCTRTGRNGVPVCLCDAH